MDWRAVGCSEADIKNKARSVRQTVCGLAIVTVASVTAASREAVGRPSAWGALNAALMSLAWSVDTFGTPPVSGDTLRVTSTIGPFAFFTKQALCLQTVHAWLSLWPPMLTLVHQTAITIAAIALSLTLLFLKLNWFEANWRKENYEPWRRRGVPMAFVALTAHLLPLPVALLDIAVVKQYELLRTDYIFLLSFYVFFYCALTRANYTWSKAYPYPFMRALTSNKHWLLFMIAVHLLLFLFVLPVILLAKALNPFLSYS